MFKYKCKLCFKETECLFESIALSKDEKCDDCLSREKELSKLKSKERREEKLLHEYREVVCRVCNETFKDIILGNRVYCSKECSKQFNLRPIPKVKELINVPCMVCNETFKAYTRRSKYCSDDCKKIGKKLSALDRKSKQIESLMRSSKVRVYGANIEKGKKYINEKSRKEI